MVDNEKRENLANARRKLKKFRDQHPSNGNEGHSTNGVDLNASGLSSELNGVSKSPVTEFEEQNRQYTLLIENQKQERTRLEGQRLLSGASTMSDRSSQGSVDPERKLRRDLEHLQEQLEIHVQTIGILVAEKTDVSAKLTQSFKQLERKQSEMDELYGRLKASRERVQELEKQMQNSTSNVQKREMAAKESDKENDRLKIENIRQSQLVEDLKENIMEMNEKLQHRQSAIELKDKQIEELNSSIRRIRLDNEQYQEYHTQMQQHIQQLTETNRNLQERNKEDSADDHLQQENQLFRNAIDQWSSRYEDLRVKLEQTTKLLNEKDELIREVQTSNSIDKVPVSDQTSVQSTDETLTAHLNESRIENADLKTRIQELEHVIEQLQSETETIGDYIRLYQQQREQLQKRYQEKDDSIQQLTQDREDLQKKLSEFERLFVRTFQTPREMNSTSAQSLQLNDETKEQILALIHQWGVNHPLGSNDRSSIVKQAFVDKNLYICSTCSGSVYWV